MLKIDAKPLPTTSDRPPLTRFMANIAVSAALYTDADWPALSEALASAKQGDGALLLALYDSYYGYRLDGTWGNGEEAYRVIQCIDYADHPTVEEADAAAPSLRDVAPRMKPWTIGDYEDMCAAFPSSDDPSVTITGVGAGPIVVCGTTGDPATPFEGTRRMASALEDGRLVVVAADQHTCYGITDCADDIIDHYLVDLDPPADETNCASVA